MNRQSIIESATLLGAVIMHLAKDLEDYTGAPWVSILEEASAIKSDLLLLSVRSKLILAVELKEIVLKGQYATLGLQQTSLIRKIEEKYPGYRVIPLFIVPRLSPRMAELLREMKLNVADIHGNIDIRTESFTVIVRGKFRSEFRKLDTQVKPGTIREQVYSVISEVDPNIGISTADIIKFVNIRPELTKREIGRLLEGNVIHKVSHGRYAPFLSSEKNIK